MAAEATAAGAGIAAYNLGALFDPALGGDRVGLIDCGDWERPRRYSHRELDALADACANGLVGAGLEPGDAVAILSANRAEFLIAFFAILRAGMVAVPIDHRLPQAMIDFIVADAAVRLAFCDGARRPRLAGLPVVDYDGDAGDGFGRFLRAGPFAPVRSGPGDAAMILYTSGSTGRPKGALLTHAGHLWALRARARAGWPFTAERMLVAAPLHHMNALCTSLFALGTSACEVLLPAFAPRRYLEAIARFGCSWVTAVPAMLALALRENDLLEALDLSVVKTVRMGSSPIPRALWREVERAFPGARIVNGYGTTEAGPVVFAPRPDRGLPELSVGWPVPGVDVRLVDRHGREGDEGVLWQRTPAMMGGYVNLPEATREVLTGDGWFRSGDVFRRGADGAYFFVGRADDMFVSGGNNVFPAEVERMLETHPGIAEACVVPVADEIKGAKPVAFVVARAGAALDEDDVRRYALAHAPAYRHPRRVFVLGALPLAGPGKVDRRALAARAAAIEGERHG